MMEERGVIIALEDKYAWVETSLKSSCSHCTTTSCGTGALAAHFNQRATSIRVENSFNAKPGDKVVIGLDENSVLLASVLVYILPLLTLFLGGYLGLAGADNAATSEGLSIFGGIIGFIAGFVGSAKISKSIRHRNKMEPVMLKLDSEQVVSYKPL
jgi:sigma-E factor negative regulatory protein RseC